MYHPKPEYSPLEIYHIFNHANGWENIFLIEENYHYFLRKYAEKLHDVVETLAYCLLPNHFHLLVRVRNSEELDSVVQKKEKVNHQTLFSSNDSMEVKYHKVVRRQFHNFLSGYAKAFNKYHNRKGSLLRQNTRRKIVGDDSYLRNVIVYLHLNPVLHGFTSFPEDWPHSSYHAYTSNKKTKLSRTEVLNWFGGKEAFIAFHQQRLKEKIAADLIEE